MGCCTVWILSTRHAKNNVSRSPLWRLHWTCLSPKFISFPKCNASFFSPPCFLPLSSGSRLNYQLTGSGSFLFLIPQEKTSCAGRCHWRKKGSTGCKNVLHTVYVPVFHTWDSSELQPPVYKTIFLYSFNQRLNPECTDCLYFLFFFRCYNFSLFFWG